MKLFTLINDLKKRDTQKGFYIVGIEKCGTTSLEQWYRSKGHVVVREESIYFRWYAKIRARILYPNMKIVLIIRDPVERVYSHYNYKRYYQQGDRNEIKCDLQTALKEHPEILRGSNYSKWIKKWNPNVVYDLRQMQMMCDFPKENINSHPIPTSSRILIEGAL